MRCGERAASRQTHALPPEVKARRVCAQSLRAGMLAYAIVLAIGAAHQLYLPRGAGEQGGRTLDGRESDLGQCERPLRGEVTGRTGVPSLVPKVMRRCLRL